LIAELAEAGTIRFATEKPVDHAELERLPGVQSVSETRSANGDGAGAYSYLLRAPDPDRVLSGLLGFSQRDGLGLRALEVLPGSLEDVFLQLTGRELRD
jgi:hypothetical protein